MDPHTESVAEAPESGAVEALPDTGEEASFESSLEAAFAQLDAVPAAPEVEEEPLEVLSDELPAEPAAEEPEPAPQEPVESLTEDIGDDWTPKAASRFKQLKSELKSSKSELDMMRQQQQEHQSKIQELTGLTENKDIDALQTKLETYESQQMVTNLEATDAYKQAVSDPLAALMEQAGQLADKYDVDADALVDILSLNDQKQQDESISELLPTANDRDKAKIYRIMEDIDPIVERRQKLLENAEGALAEAKLVDEQKAAQSAAENAQLRTNVTRNVIERVQQKLPFLSGIDGLDMKAVQTQAAESDPSVIHPVDHAYNAVSAQLLPNIVREYVSMRKENEALTDRLAEYEGAEPTMSGQSASGGTGPSADMSFEQSIAAALGGA
tara:strand:+ start:3568 stop:4722 length:1155 start_codon:yes stop_codon:yes gene_type:complete